MKINNHGPGLYASFIKDQEKTRGLSIVFLSLVGGGVGREPTELQNPKAS